MAYRRRYRRRRFRKNKALRIVRSLARKIDAEVKKADFNVTIPSTSFAQITPFYTETSTYFTLPDYAYMYPVLNYNRGTEENVTYMNQGDWLGDFIGERIRTKYLYLGFHLQMPYNISSYNATCLRIMVVQDRNYGEILSYNLLIANLFGVNPTTIGPDSENRQGYIANSDFTLLPINPQEPGRFNVMRDFKMTISPGGRMDYYKKVMIMQRDMLDGGRIYFSNDATDLGKNEAPGDRVSGVTISRNNIYVLILLQSNTQTTPGQFYLSIQSRLNYYDN